VLTTGFVIAPVAFHRILFRRREKEWLVTAANRTARIGLLLLAFTSSGVLFLVFDVVVSTVAAVIAFAIALAFFVLLWGAIPLSAPTASED